MSDRDQLLVERLDRRWWLTPDPDADEHRAVLSEAVRDWRDPVRELRDYRPTVRERTDNAIEDIEWLLSFGTAVDEVARRLGTNRAALSRRLYRAGRPDLANRIEERAA